MGRVKSPTNNNVWPLGQAGPAPKPSRTKQLSAMPSRTVQPSRNLLPQTRGGGESCVSTCVLVMHGFHQNGSRRKNLDPMALAEPQTQFPKSYKIQPLTPSQTTFVTHSREGLWWTYRYRTPNTIPVAPAVDRRHRRSLSASSDNRRARRGLPHPKPRN